MVLLSEAKKRLIKLFPNNEDLMNFIDSDIEVSLSYVEENFKQIIENTNDLDHHQLRLMIDFKETDNLFYGAVVTRINNRILPVKLRLSFLNREEASLYFQEGRKINIVDPQVIAKGIISRIF